MVYDSFNPLLPHTIVIRGQVMELSQPLVMGILNITPDSFYAGSRVTGVEEAVEKAGKMLEAGADILDIGGCSTRPGSVPAEPEEEMRRLAGPVGKIREAFPEAIISVDTFRASVAGECLGRWNVDIINDVGGGEDPEMFSVVARHHAAYVLMHKRGTPASMDACCDYTDVVADVVSELAFRLAAAREAGISDVFVDPGFGFAKSPSQGLSLLKHLEEFKVLGCPVLVGFSRKRMAREACGNTDGLVATVALNAVALSKGASIIRVHDVKEGVETARIIGQLWNLE